MSFSGHNLQFVHSLTALMQPERAEFTRVWENAHHWTPPYASLTAFILADKQAIVLWWLFAFSQPCDAIWSFGHELNSKM
jgi:hypothetical protein